MSGELKILIVGGYGTFGGRLVELLEPDARLTLIISGRSATHAQAYCRGRAVTAAKLVPAAFDRDGDLPVQLASLRPDILVDASGPFQAYGNGGYRVIEACIAARVHYFDLADGSDFVAGVSAFDAAARAAGIYVLSGASSFPVLSAAVVRRLAARMTHIDSIRAGIAPSPFAGVGENVIRAIASYAGQRVPLVRDGKAADGYPFTEHFRFTIAPPGYLPLRSTLFSLVDVPDLRVFPQLWPEAKDVWMGAGPVPELLHRTLITFAWLVRLRLLASLSPLARLMHFVTNHLQWGEHRGGMFVEVAGTDAKNMRVTRSWHLIAEGDDGPLIPSMAAEALIRRILAGRAPPRGARAAVQDLELADYETIFARRRIFTGTRHDRGAQALPLYARVLGAAWDSLPNEIRCIHDIHHVASASGRATVERGRGILARLAGRFAGFPRAAVDTVLQVRFAVVGGTETWARIFGSGSFSSRQFAGHGRSDALICEAFGPLTFAMALAVADDRLALVLRRWGAFGIPLPLWLGPRMVAHETVENGRFHFHVEIGHLFTGLIVRYRGWLVPDA